MQDVNERAPLARPPGYFLNEKWPGALKTTQAPLNVSYWYPGAIYRLPGQFSDRLGILKSRKYPGPLENAQAVLKPTRRSPTSSSPTFQWPRPCGKYPGPLENAQAPLNDHFLYPGGSQVLGSDKRSRLIVWTNSRNWTKGWHHGTLLKELDETNQMVGSNFV